MHVRLSVIATGVIGLVACVPACAPRGSALTAAESNDAAPAPTLTSVAGPASATGFVDVPPPSSERIDVPVAAKPEGDFNYRRRGTQRLGPPPPGYFKITGEPVPDWRWGYQARTSPLTWQFIGPRPISSEYWSGEANAAGRVVSIAPHPTNANIVYIASASGGVWKTTNATAASPTWTPMSDELATLNHGAIALDPANPDHVYVGTGEYQQGSNGGGVFKSIDGGLTWSRIATTSQVGSQCSEIIVMPGGQTIHLTGSGGYCRTTNGGGTWAVRLSGSCSALEVDSTNPQVVYVGRRSQGVYKSTDGGGSFTRLSNGLPASGYSRIVMDLSKSNPNVLFAAFINGGSIEGLYKTIDAGATWTRLADAPNFCSPQCWYDAYIGISPTSENTVFLGGVDPRYAVGGIMRSTDGGATFVEMTGSGNRVHPDHHAIAWGPTGTIWEGNDGGVWRSTNGGVTWQNMNATLAVSQMYHIALHPSQPERALGGTQDNGTPERTGNSFTWPQTQTGDGGFSVYDFTNTSTRYTTYVYMSLSRWINNSSRNISGPWDSDSTNWISPFTIDPTNNNILIAGTNRVWKTTNALATTPAWNPISDNTLAEGGTLNYIAVASTGSQTIYVGNSGGGVFVTTDGGTTWHNRSAGLPRNGISQIEIDPGNPARAYIANYGTSGGRVYRTADFGQTWTGISGALPSGVAGRALAVDFVYNPPVVYLGSGSGVYLSLDDGDEWIKDDASLPNVNVGSLSIHRAARTITVGTYGRGAWRAPLAVPPPCIADYNRDGGVDGADVEAFFLDWQNGNADADVNQDGGVDGGDVEAFFLAWESGAC